jgi:hypothetical protein
VSDIQVASLDAVLGNGHGADSPEAGDSIWIYDAGAPLGPSGEAWHAHLVNSATPTSGSCVIDPQPGASPLSARVTRLSLHPPPAARLRAHAPVRAFRRVRYALYESADGWFLGFADCRPVVRTPACATIQPVSGPYNRHALPGGARPSGLTLTYRDGSGVVTADERAVSRIDIAVAAPGPFGARLHTMDASVALRNDRR